jgi:molybdenum cofactor cytidylyltransferase
VNPAAVILAGGASSRMGSPKALLHIDGETFADRLIGVFDPVCSQVVVVLGHHAEQIRKGIKRAADFVFNSEHALGQLTSLQCGLRAVREDADAVLFTPVDYPAFRGDTVRLLVSRIGDAPVIVPRFDGRHGHPVLVSRQVAREFLTLAADRTARDVIHRHVGHTLYIDVDDPGILRDVDDPAAYRALLQAAR